MRLSYRVETSVGERGITVGETLFNSLPQLLGEGVAGVLDGQVATLGSNLLSGEGTSGVPPSGVGPPLLDGLDLFFETLLLLILTHGCCDGGGEDGGDCGDNLLQSFGQLDLELEWMSNALGVAIQKSGCCEGEDWTRAKGRQMQSPYRYYVTTMVL